MPQLSEMSWMYSTFFSLFMLYTCLQALFNSIHLLETKLKMNLFFCTI